MCPQWLLCMDDSVEALENHAVLIDGPLIAQIGPKEKLISALPQVQATSLPNQILMPGLINCHTHAGMTLLRGAADDMALHDWLQKRIWPLEAELADAEFVYDSTILACSEMLKGGTTTFNDMYFFPESTVRAATQMGARVMAGIITIEFPTRYGSGPDEYIEKSLACRDQYKDHGSVHWTVAPHAPYTVSNETFERMGVLAEELDLPIHCHLHETASEVADAVCQDGKRPFERLNEIGLINERFLAVHGVHLSEKELSIMASKGSSLIHCPASNLKLASGLAPTAKALQIGVNVAIGTDGAASNNKLDLWEEGRMAALLAKGASLDATAWPAGKLLQSLTCDAAKALGMEHKLGRIRAGFLADLISVQIHEHAHQEPVLNIASRLAYSSRSNDVQEVWVHGQQVVSKQQLMTKGKELEADSMRKVKGLWQTRIKQLS